MIVFQNVSKTYGSSPKKALDELNLTIADGEIFAFLGQNGAGKTTAIKLLSGILAPDSGTILIDRISIEERPLEAKKRISLASDEPDLPTRFTGSEFLQFAGEAYGLSQKESISSAKEYANLFGIAEKLHIPIIEYSHGMKQKLQLAAGLLNDPHNWVLDEPLNGLDPDAAFTLKELMRKRARANKTVFFSTHIMEVAEKLCDKVGILREGKLLFTGTLKELRAQYGDPASSEGNALESIFLHLTNS